MSHVKMDRVPSRRRACLPALAAALLLAGPTVADEIRLHDGRVLVGTWARKADQSIEVTTRDGLVVVQANEVREIVSEETLRQNLQALAKTSGPSAFAQLQLAIQAQACGLTPEMWRHLDRAVERRQDPDTAASVHRRLVDFLAQLEAEVLPRRFRTAATKVRVHQLLDQVHASTGPGRNAAIAELLAREPNADQDLRTEARRNGNPRQRIAALAALQRRQLAGNDRFVLRTAILDGSEQVRDAAISISRPSVAHDDLEYLAAGFNHENPKVRIRTADALAGLGKAEAVKWLVMAGPTAGAGLAGGGSGGERAHIAIVQQTSYVRDFDVEVAQAAAIADPKIGVIQAGTVLDVTVFGVVEERIIVRAYQKAIQQLTQRDPGDNPRLWAAWFANLQPSAPAPTTQQR